MEIKKLEPLTPITERPDICSIFYCVNYTWIRRCDSISRLLAFFKRNKEVLIGLGVFGMYVPCAVKCTVAKVGMDARLGAD
jgi:hypothetical protein